MDREEVTVRLCVIMWGGCALAREIWSVFFLQKTWQWGVEGGKRGRGAVEGSPCVACRLCGIRETNLCGEEGSAVVTGLSCV